ncbi:MAG: DUF2804 family protein [Thermoleophilaceae bacterium]|nr:DUF2804 family protein [Thermoleophilaceae bacterium]
MRPLPVRGAEVRGLGLPLPPERMPLLHGRRPLKRWRYVGLYRPDLMLCVGEARVAGLPQRWWALAMPDGTLRERTTSCRGGIDLAAGRARVDAGQVQIDLTLDEGPGVEVASPSGGSWIWTRKQAPVRARGNVRLGDREWAVDGDEAFVDESAGYHARHTVWRWSAGIGRTVDGRSVAWNLVDGVHDADAHSERTVWVGGEPSEAPPATFAEDLSRVGELAFTAWCAREDHTRRLIFRSHYLQPFGSFRGELPGGLRLESGHGVMEWHDVLW